jgi:hypothetical protein
MATTTDYDFGGDTPGEEVLLLPNNYQEYYGINVVDFMMDLFKTADKNKGLAVKSPTVS